MKNPSKEKFKLEKVKLISGGGMAVKFQVEEVIGAESYRSGQDITSSKEPHPDLTDRLRQLREMVAQVFCYSIVKTIVSKDQFKADKAQKAIIDDYFETMVARVNVTGFSVSGEENKRGVVITSTFTVDNNQKVAMNTPRILLSAESRGFEEQLSNLVDDIEAEVYAFVYENKVANPEIFDYVGTE